MSATFTKPSDLISGTTARAQDINNRVDGIETGFDNVEVITNRSIKLPAGTNGDQLISESAANRANKEVGFNAAGALTLINSAFQWKGNWATNTAFIKNDTVRDNSTKNIYAVVVDHTSGTLSSDISASKLQLVINVADVETAKTAAETARDLAQDWAEKTNGVVTGSSYSAKHWATTGTVATVSSAIANVNTVAGSISNVNTVAGKQAQITLLGTSDAVADMNTLATSDVVSDMNTLGTSDVVSDMNTLGTADVVSDMNTLGTSSNVSNMNTLAGISSNITTVAGISSAVTTAANNTSAIQAAPAHASTASTQAGIATTKAQEAAASASSASGAVNTAINNLTTVYDPIGASVAMAIALGG
tara:strand:- start:290 stop:1375 length:1086 start_codon:yes stop_codon:yes gene_type:complete